MSPEEEDEKLKPTIVAKPVSKDDDEEDSDKSESAKTAKPVDEDIEKRDNRYYGPPSQQTQQSQYPPQYPPQAPLFSPQNVTKLITFGLLIGIICLFIGSMLTAGAKLTDTTLDEADDSADARDFQNTMLGAGALMAGIGLFLMSIFLILPLLFIRNLDDKQKMIIILLFMAVIIGFSLVISSLTLPY